MANVGALDQVRTFLREHPDLHDQEGFCCGTTGCVAGWAVALDAGAQPGQELSVFVDTDVVVDRATRLLGLTFREADALFWVTVDREQPEQAALDLVDALVAREKGELTGEQRELLGSYGLGGDDGA